ncbi:MAG: SDR family oxidoreductase [Actinomycetota bacterium]
MAGVLVTGGTGVLGSEIVPRLLTKGYDVRVLSRRAQPRVPAGARTVRGDLVTGAGINDAVAGVDVIVHCASGTRTLRSLTYRSGRRTDVEATRRMLDGARRSGATPFVVYISIVGIDRIPLGYYRAKLETEQVIEASGLPYSTLRTTQWHTFAWEIAKRLTAFPVVLAPKGLRLQLLDPGEVADRMVSLLEAGPAGMTPDMGGPETLDIVDVLRSYLRAKGKRRAVASVRFPGRAVAAFAAGHNLTPAYADGRIAWEDWLAQHAS